MFATCKINILPNIEKDHPHSFDFSANNWSSARASAKEKVGVSEVGVLVSSLRMLYANGKETK